MRRFAKVGAITVAFVAAVLFGSRLVVQEITRFRTSIRSTDAVNLVERVELGGLEQSLLIAVPSSFSRHASAVALSVGSPAPT